VGRLMGLTLYYDWKTKSDMPSAGRMIARRRTATISCGETKLVLPGEGAKRDETASSPD
jgi:hypothetical protein